MPNVTYTIIHDDAPEGHRVFLGSDGQLYIADRSGRDPDFTDDGPLMLRPTAPVRHVEVFGGMMGVSWDVYVVREDREARTVLALSTALTVAAILDVEIQIAGRRIERPILAGGV